MFRRNKKISYNTKGLCMMAVATWIRVLMFFLSLTIWTLKHFLLAPPFFLFIRSTNQTETRKYISLNLSIHSFPLRVFFTF